MNKNLCLNSLKKKKIYDLLKGIETGDSKSVKVVNEGKYIQHNPQTREGGEGLAELFSRLSKTNPKVEIIRLFEDGDYVFGHTIYDFSSLRVGFEVFRFEGDYVVEHWDNIQLAVGDMTTGATDINELDQTEKNRSVISSFCKDLFLERKFNNFYQYVDEANYVERSSYMSLFDKLKESTVIANHKILVEGNFALAVNEGKVKEELTSFYDLFRIEDRKIVEHWDTIEKIPPRNEWKNNNGKF